MTHIAQGGICNKLHPAESPSNSSPDNGPCLFDFYMPYNNTSEQLSGQNTESPGCCATQNMADATESFSNFDLGVHTTLITENGGDGVNPEL